MNGQLSTTQLAAEQARINELRKRLFALPIEQRSEVGRRMTAAMLGFLREADCPAITYADCRDFFFEELADDVDMAEKGQL